MAYREVICDVCNGSGKSQLLDESGKNYLSCPFCDGTGKYKKHNNSDPPDSDEPSGGIENLFKFIHNCKIQDQHNSDPPNFDKPSGEIKKLETKIMKGYTRDEYAELIKDYKAFINVNPMIESVAPISVTSWLSGRGQITEDQKVCIVKSLKKATAYSLDQLLEFHLDIAVPTWISMSGSGTMSMSGTMSTSTASEEELSLNFDFTYSYDNSLSTAVTVPDGFSPSPLGSAHWGSSSSHKGLYIVSAPDQILLITNYGACLPGQYFHDDYILYIENMGRFWRK